MKKNANNPKPKKSDISKKALPLSTICDKCHNNNQTIIKYVIDLINNIDEQNVLTQVKKV